KLFGLSEFSDFEPLRLSEFNSLLHVKDRFPASIADMNMYGSMLVTIKEEPVAVLLENSRHILMLPVSDESVTVFSIRMDGLAVGSSEPNIILLEELRPRCYRFQYSAMKSRAYRCR